MLREYIQNEGKANKISELIYLNSKKAHEHFNF